MSSDDTDELQSARRKKRPSEPLNVAADYDKSLSATSNAAASYKRSPSQESNAAVDHDAPPSSEPCRGRIVVAVPALSRSYMEEYREIHSDVVERVVEEVVRADGKDLFYQVEFRDGRHGLVSFDELLGLRNGSNALATHQADSVQSSSGDRGTKRKRSSYDVDTSDTASDGGMTQPGSDDDDLPRWRPARRTRLVRRQPNMLSDWVLRENANSAEREKPSRKLRPRLTSLVPRSRTASDDIDELAQDPPPPPESSDEDDDDFDIIRSDLGPAPKRSKARKRSKRLKRKATRPRTRDQSRGSSIEFEQPRRSGRATKNNTSMKDPVDLDSFYISDDKAPAAPRVVTIKEVFKPLPDDSDFVKFHMSVCGVCNRGQSLTRGILIYCQGCTMTYHKMCIGIRQTREHIVTKVDTDDFVIQCRFCVGRARVKDKAAARQSMCQACRKDGLACAPFSQKKTPKQEEAIRQANGGDDPITPVPPSLVNNADNVLFRCVGCRRPWHIEHLPRPAIREAESDLAEVKNERFNEYSTNFLCQECSSRETKIHTLVAWRPTQTAPASSGDASWSDLVEDDKEYLVKWEGRSYSHCTWKPGAWIFGVASGTMRSAFGKRDAQKGLKRLNEEEAIPQEYLLADVILQVKYSRSAPRAATKEVDLARICHVIKIYVKFQGLGYDEVVWDDPPREGSALYEAFEAAYAEYINGRHFESDSASKMKDRLKQFRAKNFKEDIELETQPPGLTGKLMKYQLQGVNWMLHRYYQGQNAILADEMGLGKTVQVIALISTLAFENPRCSPFLIVVPNSTCANWRREIKYWKPDLRVVAYYGGRQSQELAYQYELFPDKSKDLKAHIVVMSYDSAQDERTRSLFRSVSWAGLVVDEGQRLKNDKNLLYRALQTMHFPFQLLLTGTPLQNNQRELFNLLQFVDRQHDAMQLDQEYQGLTAEKVRKLHRVISPYFFRRTKAGVLKFLPGMAQVIVPVTMTVVQEKLCKSIMAKNPELIRAVFANGKLGVKERGSLNNILMQLRKCLCHPFIYSEAIEERDADPETMHRNLVEASGKLLLLEGMLAKLKEQGHRVLIFSQFLNQLDIVEDFLTGMGFSFRRLDGSMSSLEKQRRIDAYNAPGSDIFAFLLSTRAGGVGINLATADTVIIMDPDFNPHQDMQALSRAHRIGQSHPVLCFQLMTRNSVEEKIMQAGKNKMALDHALIDKMDTAIEGEDIEGVLRHGAEALFGEHEREVIRYDDAALEKLLDRNQAAKPDAELSSEEPNFSYGRIWSADKGAIEEGAFEDSASLETPELHRSVWDSILAQREAEAQRDRKRKKEVLGRGGRRRQKINYRTNVPQLFGLDPGDLSESDHEENARESEDYSDRGAENDAISEEEAENFDEIQSDIRTVAATEAAAPAPQQQNGGQKAPRKRGQQPRDPAQDTRSRVSLPNTSNVANGSTGQQRAAAQDLSRQLSYRPTGRHLSRYVPSGVSQMPTPHQYSHQYSLQGRPGPHVHQGQVPVPGSELSMAHYPQQIPTAPISSKLNQHYYTGQGGASTQRQASPAPPFPFPSQPYQPASSNDTSQQGPLADMSNVNNLTKGEIRVLLDNIQHSQLPPQVAAAKRSILKRRLTELEYLSIVEAK